jgi:serine/threonine-protein kinase
MAVVYAATHRNQKRFAIKMLHADLSSRQDVCARFLREGYAANTVDHPGAVAVLDDDISENGVAFLVMELLDGESVERIWAKSGHKIPVGPALAIVHQLMEILAAAHAKSMVHRDVKPANLFITRDGQLKVLDFGIARVRDAAASAEHATGTGLVLGTPSFMAPEQALAKSQEIDARTDVWAAGATLFTLLTGRNVHEGDNGQQVLVRAATILPRCSRPLTRTRRARSRNWWIGLSRSRGVNVGRVPRSCATSLARRTNRFAVGSLGRPRCSRCLAKGSRASGLGNSRSRSFHGRLRLSLST